MLKAVKRLCIIRRVEQHRISLSKLSVFPIASYFCVPDSNFNKKREWILIEVHLNHSPYQKCPAHKHRPRWHSSNNWPLYNSLFSSHFPSTDSLTPIPRPCVPVRGNKARAQAKSSVLATVHLQKGWLKIVLLAACKSRSRRANCGPRPVPAASLQCQQSWRKLFPRHCPLV